MVPIPAPEPAEGQIRVRPAIGCLCGSDLPYFFGDSGNPMVRGRKPPLDPGLSLHELTGWALGRGIELEALEVTRPSLEDVYLEITGTAVHSE